MTETKMQLEDWLDDLCVRFIINLPREELESVERICFQVEEAQWFYEDFIRPLDPALPSLSLKAFALRIFQHCPLMSQWSHYHHITAFSEFLAYKTRVPVRGAIMLNQDMDEVVLVKGWKKGANWSFPRGKINKDEKDLDCAIREVYEETGFDIRDADLVKDEKDVKFIEITMREQHMRLYVFRGVPRDAYFEPRTRKEISKIEWYNLSELPTLKRSKQYDQGFAVANANKFYMVAPFMHPLKKWIAQQKKIDAKMHPGVKNYLQNEGEFPMDEGHIARSILTPPQAPVEMAAPSDLPEVISQDASSHLKRLLNINNLPVQAQSPQPDSDASKSNALLTLLRDGSNDTAPQNNMNSPSPPHAFPGPMPPMQQPYPGPNTFPGFPPQAQFARPPVSSAQVPPPMQHGAFPPHLPPAPPVGFQGPLGPLDFPPRPPYPERPIQSELPFPAAERHAPAPFHHTGDPFSAQAQPSQIQGAAVPPASKLPPPKLTSHSLALLNVFKDEKSKTPKTSNATLAPTPGQIPIQGRKPSHHQDQLLGLLKGSAPSPAPGPVELSAQPVSPVPAVNQTLQGLPIGSPRSKKQGFNNEKAPRGQPRTSATVSGPLNMPHFEGMTKPSPRKGSNTPNRKPNKDRQTPPVASPITILPRPQAAKRDQSPASTKVSRPSSARSGSQPRSNKAKSPEPAKPFQPQILRRSDKVALEDALPIRSKTDGPSENVAPEPETQSFDRRPSQTAAQKEALLSLFGRQAASPSNVPSQLNIQASAKPSATSSIVSPMSPMNPPAGGDPISGYATPPSENPSTPGNKAFLLGFLEGVAKGNK